MKLFAVTCWLLNSTAITLVSDWECLLTIIQNQIQNQKERALCDECKTMPTQKAGLLWMTSHYGSTVIGSVTKIPFHIFI